DPRSWNRYSYTRNVVTNRVDPLGLDDEPAETDPADEGPVIRLSVTESFLDEGGGFFFGGAVEPIGPPNVDGGGGGAGGLGGDEPTPTPDNPPQQPGISPGCRRALRTAWGVNRRRARQARNRATAQWDVLSQAAGAHGLDPNVLAAVGLRETLFRNITGDHGHGIGVFQFDTR